MASAAPASSAPAPSPALALAPWLERFVQGRRVAILGDATTGLARELVGRGARLVHVFDPEPARVSRALVTMQERGVSFAPLTSGDLGVRDGAFDVAVILDVGSFADTRSLFARVRQLVSPGGLVVALTLREGRLGYYDLYDAVSLQFAEVRMVGQVPFAGFALVDFGAEGEPEVSVDTSLAGEREPSFFVALGSNRPVAIDGYAVVQLPGVPAAAPREEDRQANAELVARIEALKTELEHAREGRRAAEARVSEEQRRVADLAQALAQAELVPRRMETKLVEEARRSEVIADQLAKSQALVERLSQELRAREDATRDSIRGVQEAQAELRRAAGREQALLRKIAELESMPRVDEEAVETLRREAARLARRVAELEAEPPQDQTHAQEIESAEAALRERAREIAVLRHEVERRGAMVRELLDALESRSESGEAGSVVAALERELAEARAKLRTMANELAARDAALEAGQVRMRELEKAAHTHAAPETQGHDERLTAALAEIDALRRALLQEREARLRAESKEGGEADPFASVLLDQVQGNRG